MARTEMVLMRMILMMVCLVLILVWMRVVCVTASRRSQHFVKEL